MKLFIAAVVALSILTGCSNPPDQMYRIEHREPDVPANQTDDKP